MCKELEKYLSLFDIKYNIREELKTNNELDNIIKGNLDNKYIKYMWIKNGIICFKANKKMREKISKDIKFLDKYMNIFLSKIFRMIDIKVSSKELSVLTDITTMEDENKIYITI